ncbi:MAG TPA: DNA repair protein RecO [Candidatus Limnocylindrales bacterium]|nr:DNA repair protein RecO [Candidatus Limnocylindrales bacterium]
MGFKKTEAFIIRSFDINEADKIIVFYSKSFGKLRGIARGSRKLKNRFGSSLELFTRVQVNLFEKETYTFPNISQADIIESFSELRGDLRKLASAASLVELVDKGVGENEESPPLYDLISQALRAMVVYPEEEIDKVLITFEIKFLTLSGYSPVLDRCAQCRNPLNTPRVLFSLSKGGGLCKGCTGEGNPVFPTSLQALQILKQLLKMDLEKCPRLKISEETQREIKMLLRRWLDFYLEVPLKAPEFLDSIRRLTQG